MLDQIKILIIAAHPDDETLGCGGSIAKWSKSGHEVHVLIMAEVVTSRDKPRDREHRIEDLSILAQSANQAADILGVETIELLDYPDNRMDSVNLLDVVKSVEKRIEKLQPTMVVTHHAGDLNIDHKITHQAVITACRPIPGQTVKRILSFEVPSATEWQSSDAGRTFVPNWFEDITDTLPMKMKALEVYKSEMRPWPHVRSIKAGEHLARWRGASAGFEAAESFMLERNIS